jgi:hypothetical protein
MQSACDYFIFEFSLPLLFFFLINIFNQANAQNDKHNELNIIKAKQKFEKKVNEKAWHSTDRE